MGLLRFLSLIIGLSLMVGCHSKAVEINDIPSMASQSRDQFYFEQVRPLLDQRCVTCHACYTSPCQLNLAEHEGIRRGATKIRLYEGSRLTDIDPTRLGIDAHGPKEWQEKGFFPVAHDGDNSLLMAMVRQRAINREPVKQKAKESFVCAKDSEELNDFLKDHAEKGMPYGLPPLKPEEMGVLTRWLNDGYPTLSPTGKAQLNHLTDEEQEEIRTWETQLNQLDPKSRLIARYLYEHLFLADIEFSDAPGSFFKLVRSTTASPQAVDPVKTRRPFDEAGIFHYRFQKITQTITHKNHIIYPLSAAKMKRFRELFYDAKWAMPISEYPSYDPEIAGNPFLVYQNIPVESRYQFLLDNALFFVSSFIKGTVCEGEAAVSVIDEKFFIFFVDPDNRTKGSIDAFTAHVASDLKIPSQRGILANFYWGYKESQMKFVEIRKKAIDALYPLGASLYDIWDGDGVNSQAVLTVFRHDDNSYVKNGAIGEVPKTVWVMDYQIFERMYYLLAAGFDVFGGASHQVSTRLYMDNLRVESEDMFLSFLPAETRDPLRKSWYRGDWAKKKMELLNPYGGISSSPKIKYTTKDVKAEFVRKVLNERMIPAIRGYAPLTACCGIRETAETKELIKLTRGTGHFIKILPDIALLRIEHTSRRPDMFSIIRHRSHSSVAFLLDEKERLLPDEDTLTIQSGVMGSFPNFFLSVKDNEIADFVRDTEQLSDLKSPEFQAWVKRYGISRGRDDFWTHFDAFQSWFDEAMGSRGGYLDLSKYELW